MKNNELKMKKYEKGEKIESNEIVKRMNFDLQHWQH